MARKVSLWLAAVGIAGLILSAAIWHIAAKQLHAYISSGKPFQDHSVITAIVEDSIHNPDVQQMLHAQIMLYLRSPEGKTKLAEMMKSPEMVKVMADNLQSPEFRPALIRLMHDPAFRETLIEIIREAPEMRILRLLDTAIEWDIPESSLTGRNAYE